jgi:heat shock protein HslJ
MKNQIFLLLLIVALAISCASTNTQNFSDTERNEVSRVSANISSPSSTEGNEWKLIEVYIDGRNTRFSRDTLPEELKNFFTLIFDAQNVSGVGAPNRYSAPYTMGDNQAISVMLMRSTMMASFFQPENLSEHDFFTYMQNSYSWKLTNNNLELLSKTATGGEVRLVFSQE